MKIKHLITAVPLFAIALVIAHNSSIKSLPPDTDPLESVGSDRSRVVSVPENRQLPQSEEWEVVRVSDGDTISVRQGSRKERIRFCGIDAVEAHQKLGPQATDHLRSLISKGDGTIIITPIETDRYGRTIAELFVKPQPGTPGYQPEEEIFLNGEMVRAGLSYHYAKYSERCPNRDAIIKAEAIARSKHVGVWRDQYSIPPWEFRKQQRQNRGN